MEGGVLERGRFKEKGREFLEKTKRLGCNGVIRDMDGGEKIGKG